MVDPITKLYWIAFNEPKLCKWQVPASDTPSDMGLATNDVSYDT